MAHDESGNHRMNRRRAADPGDRGLPGWPPGPHRGIRWLEAKVRDGMEQRGESIGTPKGGELAELCPLYIPSGSVIMLPDREVKDAVERLRGAWRLFL